MKIVALCIGIYFFANSLNTMFRFSPIYYFFTNKWYEAFFTQDIQPYWERKIPYYAAIKRIPVHAKNIGMDEKNDFINNEAMMLFYPRSFEQAKIENLAQYHWVITKTDSPFYKNLFKDKQNQDWIIHEKIPNSIPKNCILLERRK